MDPSSTTMNVEFRKLTTNAFSSCAAEGARAGPEKGFTLRNAIRPIQLAMIKFISLGSMISAESTISFSCPVIPCPRKVTAKACGPGATPNAKPVKSAAVT